MSEVRDFKAYVALYDQLRERYYALREQENHNHEYFEMNFLEIDSNAWIPRFIKGINESVILSFPKSLVDYALDNLCDMEQKLNKLSPAPERQIY